MIKDILVHVDPTPEGDCRARLAWQLAARFDAHLTGLHVDTTDEDALFYYGEMVAQAIEILRSQSVKDNQQAERSFRGAQGSSQALSEWLCVKGAIVPSLAVRARCADLVILGSGDRAGSRLVAERVPLLAGRPVLLVPRIDLPSAPLGRRILVAWDGGREAARAAHDALPFLRDAETVTILSVTRHGAEDDGGRSASALATHLSHHGIKSEVVARARHGQPIVAVLDAAIDEFSADLLVMGLYGHSPMRELILGGVTLEFLNGSSVPVFGSH